MENKYPTLSIVIVNFNGEKYLHSCLDSITENLTISYEVIIVDNNSSDNSILIIKNEYHWVKLIQIDDNMGFSKGNNYGVKRARGTFILLLNNDTILRTDVVAAINILRNNQKVGLIGGKMLGTDGEYRYSAGRFPRPHRIFMISKMLETGEYFKKGNFPVRLNEKGYTVDFVEGSFMLLRKSFWNKIGGFDENFFMYGEDVDLCYRIKKAGFDIIYYPSVEYIHLSGFNPKRDLFIVQGIIIFHKKWSPKVILYIVYFILLIRSMLKLTLAKTINEKNKSYDDKIIASTSVKSIKLIYKNLFSLKS